MKELRTNGGLDLLPTYAEAFQQYYVEAQHLHSPDCLDPLVPDDATNDDEFQDEYIPPESAASFSSKLAKTFNDANYFLGFYFMENYLIIDGSSTLGKWFLKTIYVNLGVRIRAWTLCHGTLFLMVDSGRISCLELLTKPFVTCVCHVFAGPRFVTAAASALPFSSKTSTPLSMASAIALSFRGSDCKAGIPPSPPGSPRGWQAAMSHCTTREASLTVPPKEAYHKARRCRQSSSRCIWNPSHKQPAVAFLCR